MASNVSAAFRRPGVSAARGHQTSFANHDVTVAQTGCIEVGPDLLRTILGNGANIKPVCLGEGDGLACLHRRSKAGQSHDRRAQNGEYRQGRKRFEHLGLLTVACRRSRRARGSVHNSRGKQRFHSHDLYLGKCSDQEPPCNSRRAIHFELPVKESDQKLRCTRTCSCTASWSLNS
jgi:hypothetical protein